MALISIDSKFMKFMSRFADVVLLNVLWILCCLPVFTIGASTVAAFAVTLQMVDDEEVSTIKEFFRAFVSNFRRGTGLWLIHAVALYALFLDFQLLSSASDPSIVLLVVTIVSVIFVFLTALYSYVLLARYESSVPSCLQNSLRICFQYYGRTGLLLLVLGLEAAVFAWNSTMVLFGLVIGPMIVLYTISGMAKRLFETIDKKASTSSA